MTLAIPALSPGSESVPTRAYSQLRSQHFFRGLPAACYYYC
jgi:hypothetical protein